MKEVLDYYKPKIDRSDILTKLSLTSTQHPAPSNYFLVSFHREENVDNPANLTKILTILNKLSEQYKLPVIVSTHPRTRKRLESPDVSHLNPDARRPTPHALIRFLKPFGFLDYVHLQQHALCTLSDSGTISEESAILSFPAISLRQSMERPEAQDAGTIILTGFDPEIVLSSVETTIAEFKQSLTPDASRHMPFVPDYNIPDTSWRVLKLILGNTRLSNLWNGIIV